MGGYAFPETPCIICNKAVNLIIDLAANEHGKSVHEECYVKQVTTSLSNIPTLADD